MAGASRAAATVRRLAASRIVRGAFLAAAAALGVLALADSRDAVGDSLARLGPAALAGSLTAALLAVLASGLAWRTLLADLGSPLPVTVAARIVLLGQLGKYLPGSVWAVVGQMELSRDRGVPRHRAGAAALLVLVMTLATGLCLAAVTLPWVAADRGGGYLGLLLLGPLVVVALHPRVLGPVLDRGLRAVRRPPLERPLTWRGSLAAAAWMLLTWLLYGLHLWLLAEPLGLPAARGLVLSTGGYALSWAAGLLVVVAPAGAGVREAALVAVLAPDIGPAAALVVALTSRLVVTAADLLAAGGAVAVARHPHHQTPRSPHKRDADL